MAGVTLTKSDGSFNQFSNWNGHFNLAYAPAANNTPSTLTLTAPDGYIIKGYSLLAAKAYSAAHTYTLTAADGPTITPAFASSSTGYTTLSIDDVNAQSTTISVTTTDASKFIAIADFTVTLVKPLTLNIVGDASYATLYLPVDVTTDGKTKAYYITSTNNGYAQLTEVTNDEIPAYTAVILINEEAAPNTILTRTDGLTQQVSQDANLLKGTLYSRPLDLSDATTYYSMGRLNGEIGFYKYLGGTITLGANKAYLDTSANGSKVKGFALDFGTTVSIEDQPLIHQSLQRSFVDLSGRRLKAAPQRSGVYISNGKKIIIR